MWRHIVSKRIILIFTLLTFLQIGLSVAEFDDDFGFDDEDIWTSRVKRDAKPHKPRDKRKISGGNRKKLAKRQDILEIQSGSGEGAATDTEEPGKPKYYRVTFILNEEYNNQYKDSQSKEFSELAQNLGKAVDDLYEPTPGRQSFTLVSVDEVPEDRFQIKVTGDIGTVEFFQDHHIRGVLEGQIEDGKLGTYTVLEKGFSFKHIEAGDQGSCTRADEMQCRTGALQCLPIDARCDGKRDCQGGEDEEGCPEIVVKTTPTVRTTTVSAEEVDDYDDYDVGGERDPPIEENIPEVSGSPDTSTPEPEVDNYTVDPEPTPKPVPSPDPPSTDCRGDNRFTCKDGTVICDVQICDGTRNCLQGDDEESCPGAELTTQPTITQPSCTDEQWMCDSRCLALSVRCDKVVDCADGSDEESCPTEPPVDLCEGQGDLFCGEYGAGTCTDGVCLCNFGYILKNGKCEVDRCEGKGDLFCGSSGAGRCTDGVCRCNPGYILESGKCEVDRCDGLGDRFCGEDGAGRCSNGICRCNPGYILKNGKCSVDRCEGQGDLFCGEYGAGSCFDGVCRCNPGYILENGRCAVDPCEGRGDLFCGPVGAGRCIAGECRCNVGFILDQGECIVDLCDGQGNLFCGESGAGVCDRGICRCNAGYYLKDGRCLKECSADEFQCNDGSCIDSSKKCDNEFDCRLGEDEANCRCEPDEFRCDDSRCIKSTEVCNDVSDCIDGTDEDPAKCRKPLPVCEPGEWRCGDGTCIAIRNRCDGKVDCPNDSTDEAECPCSADEWQCDFGQCIDKSLKCDGKVDCPTDESDENGCPGPQRCRSGQFQCDDGQCIDERYRCNGNFDCSDRSDEKACPPSVSTSSIPPPTSASKCKTDQFQCGSGECIDIDMFCDAIPDCSDGSDEEQGCDALPTPASQPPIIEACSAGDVTCGDGKCVSANRVCDGVYDCVDGKDERDCSKCRPDEFRCKSGRCIPQSRKCDRRNDCPDGSDELDCVAECSSNEFTCSDGTCIDVRRVCDRRYDCRDGSDERNCRPECRRDQFQCGDGTCIDESRKCDTYRDCSDGSDELGCVCRSDQFRCDSGQCIDGRRRCDRNVDCPDSSDEDPSLCGVVCQQGEFKCQNNQQCVSSSDRCNGVVDCSDQSDETGCTSSEDGLNLKTYPDNQSIKQGREVVFQCRDEGPIRAPVRWVRGSGLQLPPGSVDRNGRLEMPNIQLDHSGTYICEAVGYGANVPGSRVSVYLQVEPSQEPTVRPPTACGLHEATCMNGQCVDKSVICDGNSDCADGSDEMRCPSSGVGCEPNEFQCGNKRCVLKTWRCDGDDDCGDNSDERNCEQAPPGSPCRGDEFRCSTGSQCIPKSFHCDMEIDCQDRSDEIGCAPPTISVPPPPLLVTEVGETFSLNCTAVGKPDPEIVWRLNWGHVPSKCRVTSEAGTYGSYGVITCPNAVESDQGAYSCEAINSKGSTFAIPDAIVVVKPREGVCRNGVFNAAAVTSQDCLPCFCFGITSECSSTNLVVSQLPQPSGQFQIIGVTQDSRGYVTIRSPLSSSALRSPRVGLGTQLINRDRNQLAGGSDTHIFFNMPPSHRGNQLRSYGGYLKYNIDARGQGRPMNGPDVILVGNGYTLMHYSKTAVQPNRQSEISVQFWPGEWYKRKSSRPGGDIPSQSDEVATREEIMMALQNVEYLLIRATYIDSAVIDTTITNVRMDTATDVRGDQAVFVEECRCPAGYTGLSCETCAPGYKKVSSGPWLGQCVEDIPTSCPDGSYGDPGRGVPCQPCPCPHSTGISDELRTCYLDTDGQVTCNCPAGYEGRRCQQCGAGYTGDPTTGEVCKPVVCNVAGSTSLDLINGQCQCKTNVEGERCNQCRRGTFGLSSEVPQGCLSCFCSGVTTDCASSSSLYRNKFNISITSQHGFTLTDSNRIVVISEGIRHDESANAVSYTFRGQTQRLFWSLPPAFTANKLTSYGSHLTVTQFFEERPSPRYEDGDVILIGNGISIFWINPQPTRAGAPNTFSVPLRETGWMRMDGRGSRGSPVSREDFLTVLANLEALLVRATFSSGTTRTRLSQVTMGSVVDFDNGEEVAREVEECRCPEGYQGYSCETCSPGYYRDSSDRSYSRLGSCNPCRCSGNEESCALGENGLICNCKPGYTGAACETEAGLSQSGGLTEGETQTGPSISISFTDSQIQIVQVGSTAYLRCSANSVTRPGARITLRWTKAGGRLPPRRSTDNGRGQLTINDIQPDDAGTYTCSASDGITTVSEDAVLQIAPETTQAPPRQPNIRITIVEPRIQIVQSGQTTRLTCSARSISTKGGRITLRWSKEGGSLPARRAIDDQRGRLTISDTQPEDTGTYVCTATDGVDTAYETAVLQVEGSAAKAPVVSIEPNYVDVREGGLVEVRCLANGYPDPVISWSFGGRNLPRGATQDDGVLKIAAARKNDAGDYVCTASNPSGQTTGRVTIYVRSSSVIPPSPVFVRVEPRDSTVKRGDSVRLVCTVDPPGSYGESLYPTWTKSTGSISSRGVQSGGVLTFSGVTTADSGIYLCSVTTRSGSIEQAQARITVLAHRGPPIVRVEPEKQTISQGTGGEIRCLASGDPAPTVRWTKVNEELSSNIQINGPNLRIPSAAIEDRGVYVCTAENAGGITQAAAVIEVDRREPPTVEMYPSGRQTIINGGSAIFQCRVTQGIPSPKVKWSRQDGRALPNTVEELPGGVIRFNRVTGDESGGYICTAQNDAGVTTASAILEIQKIPTITITPSGSLRISRGQRVRLECRAEGDPIPNVSWKRVRNGVVGEADSVSSETNYYSIYEIASVTSSDEGAYSCVARNPAGVSEERLQLVVESSIPIGDPNENALVPRDEIFTVPVGGNAQMSCILSDRPPGITLEWNRADAGSMPYNHYVKDGTLYIDDVQPEASGEYVCEGVNSAGAVVFSLRARLDVIAPPKIAIQPIRQVVRPGDQATVYCTATGENPITITWSKISGQLPPSVVVNGGQLHFRSIETTDAGKYVCIAQNSAGTSEATAEVVVNADPVYSQSKNQTVQAGSDVSLRCDLPWSESLRTHWRRDRGPLPPTAVASGNILNISNVQVTDSGRYYCEVTTQGGRRSDYVVLHVENIKSLPMKITANLDNVQLGDDLELRCEVTGEPSALISWSRIGGELPRNVQPLGSVLRVYGVSTEDGGVYRCTAMTTEGRQEEDYVLAIQANVAGDSPLVETKNAPIGSTVVMDCRTNLQPPLTFHWSRQGGALPRDANHQGATLTLPSVKAEDAGTYICTATSTQDSTSLEIPTILSVTGVVPYFLQAPLSYMALSTLPDAYLQFDIDISFKPEVADGLILYNAQQDGATGDFVAFGLSQGYPEFRFDMGSGPAIIRATTPIQVGKWHTVRLSRNKKDGFMVVNDRPPYVGSASGKFQGLDLMKPLYLGAVPDFRNIHKQSGFTRGFVGCISRLVLSGKNVELSQDAQTSKGVTSCETCAVNPCLNNGVCQEAYAEQGYSCLCTPGFSGYHCEKIGETCYVGGCGAGRCVNEGASFQCYCPFGKTGPRCQHEITITEPSFRDGAYVAYPTPKALRKLLTNIRFKADDVKDSIIFYCGQNEDGQGDFISLAIKDRHVEFRFDTGSGPAILKSERPIKAGEWVTVKADRILRDGTLSVNDMPMVKEKSPGSMGGLNLKTNLFVGGWDKQKIKISPGVGVTQSFHGCISNITVSGLDQNLDLIKSVVDSANVENCESPDGACSGNPCQNGGECTETGLEPTDYTCECPPGFGGQNCEKIIDVCSTRTPCQNEGICKILSGNDFKCLCSKGWTGKTCEEGVLFGAEAGFHGDSYVELDRLLLPHSSPTATETIAIEFSTTEPNGILFWHGQKPEVDGKALDYLSLAIVDGYVEFGYELGSGPAKIVARIRVDDGKRHRVVARRTAKDGTLEVDNFYIENGQSGGSLQMLNTRGSIYIGGVPNIPLMTGGRHKTGFKGCIHKISIQADGPIDLYKNSLSTVNVTPCTSSSEGRGDITFSESSEKEEQQVQVQRVSRNIPRRRRRPRH